MKARIALISTGGTIEKSYDALHGVLQNKYSNLDVMLATLALEGVEIVRVPLMNKDSLDMTPADHLLIALQCEYMALEGLGQILKVVDRLKGAGVNPNLDVGGIIMTMFDSRINLAKQVVEEVRSHLPDKIFSTLIPRTVRLSEAPSFGKPIFAYDPSSPGAVAYRALGKEVAARFGLAAKE